MNNYSNRLTLCKCCNQIAVGGVPYKSMVKAFNTCTWKPTFLYLCIFRLENISTVEPRYKEVGYNKTLL